MDPWLLPAAASSDQEDTGIDTSAPRGQLQGGQPSPQRREFENSFISEPCHHGSSGPVIFEKLPDTKDYLARLEGKLQGLGGVRDSSRRSGRREEAALVLELEQGKEAALSQLVRCETSSREEVEEEVRVGRIVRRLVPEQALTQGEKVRLTRADHLEKEQEEQQKEEDTEEQEEKEEEQQD